MREVSTMELRPHLLSVCKRFEPKVKKVMYPEFKKGGDGINKY
jgi:hypothetical protein